MLVLDNRVSATGAIAGAVVGNIGAVHLLRLQSPPSMPVLLITCYLLLTTCSLLTYLLPIYYLLGDRVDRSCGHREQRHCLWRR